MKSGDKPSKSLQDRLGFLSDLASAGWDTESWDEIPDLDLDIDPEAEASYAGPVFNLRISYVVRQGYLGFEIADGQGELLLRLQLHPKDDVAPLISRITAAQDSIDAENYSELVKDLIPLCDPLLIDTDEGLYKLSL